MDSSSSSSDQESLRPGDHVHPDRALIVGDGAFAMAMATAMARRGSDVRILSHTATVRDEINAGENKTYLPGYKVHGNIKAYNDVAIIAIATAALALALSASIASVHALKEKNDRLTTLEQALDSFLTGLAKRMMTMTMMTMKRKWTIASKDRPSLFTDGKTNAAMTRKRKMID